MASLSQEIMLEYKGKLYDISLNNEESLCPQHSSLSYYLVCCSFCLNCPFLILGLVTCTHSYNLLL